MKCDQFSHENANEYRNSISIIFFLPAAPLSISHENYSNGFFFSVIVTNCKSYITFILPSLSYFLFPRSICLCVCINAFASPVFFVRFLTIWQVIEATFKIDRNKYRCVCHWNKIYLFLLPSILYFWKCPPFSMCDAVVFFHHLFFCFFTCLIVTPSIILHIFFHLPYACIFIFWLT